MNINKLNIIFAFAIIALVAINIKTCGNASDAEQLVSVKDDSITSIINKYGQQESTIAIMQGTVAEFKNLNAKKDSALAYLQKLVDKHTISATVHGTQTGNTVYSQTVITHYDTVFVNNDTTTFPVYTTKFKNKWENFNVTASKDSIKINYKVFNEFDYLVRYNKPKWYKARVAELTVTNKNPNTETLELKNFTVKQPKNQKFFVFLGGAVAGIFTVLLIR